MSEIDELVRRAENLADNKGLSLSTVSRKLFNDGKGLARLKAGGQCTLKTLETARERLTELERDTAGMPAEITADSDAAPLINARTMTQSTTLTRK